jgi:hypothetical protein
LRLQAVGRSIRQRNQAIDELLRLLRCRKTQRAGLLVDGDGTRRDVFLVSSLLRRGGW